MADNSLSLLMPRKVMKLEVDEKADAFYLRLDDSEIMDSAN